MDFYRYKDPVLNTIVSSQHEHLQRIEGSNQLFTAFAEKVQVLTTSLRSLISQNAPSEEINFVNLDIEGAELNVLRGFPWELQTPTVFAIEIHDLDLGQSGEHPIVSFMLQKGYRLQSYVFHTGIFCRANFDTELCHRVPAKQV